MLASRTNAAGEHQVEQLGFADFIVGVGVAQVVCPAQFTNVCAGVVVQLKDGKSCSSKNIFNSPERESSRILPPPRPRA